MLDIVLFDVHGSDGSAASLDHLAALSSAVTRHLLRLGDDGNCASGWIDYIASSTGVSRAVRRTSLSQHVSTFKIGCTDVQECKSQVAG